MSNVPYCGYLRLCDSLCLCLSPGLYHYLSRRPPLNLCVSVSKYYWRSQSANYPYHYGRVESRCVCDSGQGDPFGQAYARDQTRRCAVQAHLGRKGRQERRVTCRGAPWRCGQARQDRPGKESIVHTRHTAIDNRARVENHDRQRNSDRSDQCRQYSLPSTPRSDRPAQQDQRRYVAGQMTPAPMHHVSGDQSPVPARGDCASIVLQSRLCIGPALNDNRSDNRQHR